VEQTSYFTIPGSGDFRDAFMVPMGGEREERSVLISEELLWWSDLWTYPPLQRSSEGVNHQ
jgi:hypothetical protein